MSKDQASPHFGHWSLGAVFALLALAAAAISLSLNIAFGLQTSVLAALVFALSDCAKIMLPMVSAALGRWDLRRRIAWGVAVAISVTAALSSLLEGEAQRLKDSQTAAHLARDARAGIDRAQQELAAIKEPLSVTALRSLLDEARARADREAAPRRVRSQMRGGESGSRTACGAARDGRTPRGAASATRRGGKTAAKTNPETALGASDTLAALTGGDKARIATSHQHRDLHRHADHSGAARHLQRRWGCHPPAEPGPLGPFKTLRRNPKSLHRQHRHSAKSAKAVANRAYYLGRLEREFPALAARIHTGELSVYRASIKAGLRKPPARNWTQPDAYHSEPPKSGPKRTASRASAP